MTSPVRAAQDVTRDHHVEIFPTAARLSADGERWVVPVHAWVYTPQHSRLRKAAMAAVLKQKLELQATPATESNFDRRANLLFADNHRGRRLRVKIAGRQFDLQPTLPNGHSRTTLEISKDDVETHDIYGRHLAYVYLRGESFEDELLTKGYARLLVIEPNHAHARDMLQEELHAKHRRVGLWGAC